MGHQDSKKLTTAGRPRNWSRVTVPPSKAVTRRAGAGWRRGGGVVPGGGGSWAGLVRGGVAAGVVAVVAAGGAAGSDGVAQAPAATATRASRSSRVRIADDPTRLPAGRRTTLILVCGAGMARLAGGRGVGAASATPPPPSRTLPSNGRPRQRPAITPMTLPTGTDL